MTTVNALSGGTAGGGLPTTQNDTDAGDRFLKLLVAQMQNQDPLNPLDNAQVTTQMAQINTVSGIEKLNRSVNILNAQFAQMQALQGASLVGRDVVVEGDHLGADDAGAFRGGFELAGAADSVKVEVLDGAGKVIDTLDLGAEGAGRHAFEWSPPDGVDASRADRFRIVARSGAAAQTAVPLMHDRIDAISMDGDGLTLTLELRHGGSRPYADIRAFE